MAWCSVSVCVQTLLAVLCVCLSSRANHHISDSRWSDGGRRPSPTVSEASLTASTLDARCRGRFGSLPVARFALRSCAMCYVYLGNATHSRRLLPVPGHYEALVSVDANYTVTRVKTGFHPTQRTQRVLAYFLMQLTQATQEKYATNADDASDATALLDPCVAFVTLLRSLRCVRSVRCVRCVGWKAGLRFAMHD